MELLYLGSVNDLHLNQIFTWSLSQFFNNEFSIGGKDLVMCTHYFHQT